MLSISAAFAFVGLASTLVAAAPAGPGGYWSGSADWSASSTYEVAPTYTTSGFPTEVFPDGDKFRYPLSNAFPTPDAQQVNDINNAAHGSQSNNTPPSSISAEGITNLQFIAFNEIFEVAFFTELLQNITNNVDGFEVPDGLSRDFLLDTLIAIQAQEELHALTANGGLVNVAKVSPISPCEYTFPVTTLYDAIALAQTFTDVTLGTLQDVITIFAENNNDDFLRGIASVIGQEGEQNGFFRVLQNKRPSAQPFLTASARDFAFSAINQNFVVPGSCPDVNDHAINLTIFEPLTLVTPPTQAIDQYLTYSFSIEGPTNGTHTYTSTDELSLFLISGQNKPIVEDLENVKNENGVVTFDAPFNVVENLLFGLTIAAVTVGDDFTSVDEVAAATIFGPALIELY